MGQATATVTVRLSDEVKKRLQLLAESVSQPESKLAAEAIRSYVELQEWQIEEIKKGLKEAEAGEFAGDEEVDAFFEKWTDAH